MNIKPDEETNINPQGGFNLSAPNRTEINPDLLDPIKGDRFAISQSLAAKIEAIARGRTHIERYAKATDPQSLWESEDNQLALAMSVNASSQIEGEEIHATLVALILNEATEPVEGRPLEPELRHRLDVNRSIYKAYMWALTCDQRDMISPSFILNVHRLMFSESEHYSSLAGKFKDKEVVVSGARYHVKTLPSSRTEEAIKKLCIRVNHDFSKNKTDKEKPLLTIVAEFLVDFLAIHPFRDGNGRTARLLSTYLLERIGYHFAPIYPIDSIINERRAEYFQALFSAQRNWYSEHEDLTEWVEFYVDVVYEQWERAYRKIKRAKGKGVSEQEFMG
jgi:Fic family protein